MSNFTRLNAAIKNSWQAENSNKLAILLRLFCVVPLSIFGFVLLVVYSIVAFILSILIVSFDRFLPGVQKGVKKYNTEEYSFGEHLDDVYSKVKPGG